MQLKIASFLVLVEDTKLMLVSLPCSKCLYQFTCKNGCCKHVLRCGFGVGGSVFVLLFARRGRDDGPRLRKERGDSHSLGGYC